MAHLFLFFCSEPGITSGSTRGGDAGRAGRAGRAGHRQSTESTVSDIQNPPPQDFFQAFSGDTLRSLRSPYPNDLFTTGK